MLRQPRRRDGLAGLVVPGPGGRGRGTAESRRGWGQPGGPSWPCHTQGGASVVAWRARWARPGRQARGALCRWGECATRRGKGWVGSGQIHQSGEIGKCAVARWGGWRSAVQQGGEGPGVGWGGCSCCGVAGPHCRKESNQIALRLGSSRHRLWVGGVTMPHACQTEARRGGAAAGQASARCNLARKLTPWRKQGCCPPACRPRGANPLTRTLPTNPCPTPAHHRATAKLPSPSPQPHTPKASLRNALAIECAVLHWSGWPATTSTRPPPSLSC